MEAIIYMLDLLATVLLLHWAMQDADRPSNAPLFSLLRYKEVLKPRVSVLKGLIAAQRGGPAPGGRAVSGGLPADRPPAAYAAGRGQRTRGAPRADGWTDPPRRTQRRAGPGR